jgi:hypothetical protein
LIVCRGLIACHWPPEEGFAVKLAMPGRPSVRPGANHLRPARL